MDVVRRSIQALSGRISIRSKPRQGSTFTMSLPLTLAVLDGMVVTVAGETLVVPLTAIIETLQPKTAAVHGFGGNTRVIAIRDQFVPLVDVGRELDYCEGFADPCKSVALLVESEGHVRSALLVDAILGQRQVVIKSLEANYQHVHGIAAATILGDGRVALILDVDAVAAGSRAMLLGSNKFVQQRVKDMTEIDDTQGPRRTHLSQACELIAFRMGSQEFCVDIMSVREIRGWTKATVLPIVDLAARLGFPAAEPTARHVIIVAQIGEQTVGLLVDVVSDILTVTGEHVQPAPNVASDMAKTFVRGVFAVDQRMISLMRSTKCCPSANRMPHEQHLLRQ
jgi:chemotaxis protein histidine kinase CheA